jgi:DNA-binding XRE family transcriptional regulator
MKKKKIQKGSLEELKEKHFGKRGTAKREKLEKGYEQFKIGVLLQEARINRGMTQQQLADKVGTTKSYISKIENNIKEVRLSTLQKIVELGFGGQVELSIRI